MRVPARWILFVFLVTFGGLLPSLGVGENRITVRGNYYREKSTRILAPQIEFSADAPDERLTLGVSYFLDVVSSASIASGTAAATGGDNVFTELRHELGVSANSRLGAWQFGGLFRYSTETDYIGRNLSFNLGRDFLQRTLNLSVVYAYNFDRAYRIVDANGRRLPWCGGAYGSECDAWSSGTNLVQTHYVLASYAHALHKTLLLLATAEFAHVRGPQDNPYRGSMIPNVEFETHPVQRNRFAVWIGPRWSIPKVDRLVLEPRYRFSFDDWDVLTHMVDTRLHVRLHTNWTLRLRYRYYRQTEALFYDDQFQYNFNGEVFCTTKTIEGCASADPKLSSFHSHTPGIEFAYRLDGVAERTGWNWMRGGWIEATYNHVVQTSRYGNARLGSLAFSLAF